MALKITAHPPFADRTDRMRRSAIRELLRVTERPEVISFAGGLPGPELFPSKELAACAHDVLMRLSSAALQYGSTEGVRALREWVAQRLSVKHGRRYTVESVLITHGSQQALDLIGKVFLNPGDGICIEAPSYVGAIQAFGAYQPAFYPVESDEHGMIPESLRDAVHSAASGGTPLKLLYIVPNFSNPAGRTLSAPRRSEILAICEEHGLLIVEDDPYGELRFSGTNIADMAAQDGDAAIIYCGTASKIVSPGLRVGWICTSHTEIMDKLVLAKQGVDLHSSSLTQYVLASYVCDESRLAWHIEQLRFEYRKRCTAMAGAIRASFEHDAQFKIPEGGMFLWLRLPGRDTTKLLEEASKQNVVYVPGAAFYSHGTGGQDEMRLNFTHATPDAIIEGIQRLARVAN